MYITNGHLVFVSLLLWLFDFCFYGLCCFRENVATHVSGHFVLLRTHTQPLRRRCLSCHNVSRQREAAAERQSHLQLCTVHFWAALVFAVAQSLSLSLSLDTSKKMYLKKKNGHRECKHKLRKGSLEARSACLHPIVCISQAHAAQPQLLIHEPGFGECKLAWLLHLHAPPHRCLPPDAITPWNSIVARYWL